MVICTNMNETRQLVKNSSFFGFFYHWCHASWCYQCLLFTNWCTMELL